MMTVPRILAVLTLVAAVQAVQADSFPLTVEDDRGVTLHLNERPERIAAISTFGADAARALGVPALGITTLNNQHSVYLGADIRHKTHLGEVHEANFEALSDLSPDLIIGMRTYTEPFADQFERIAPLLAFDLITLEDSLTAVERTASAMGLAAAGSGLNDDFQHLLSEYSRSESAQPSVAFVWHWADVPYVYTDATMQMQLLQALGATNALNRIMPEAASTEEVSRVVSMEQLLAMDPDVIISFKGDSGPLLGHPVWPRLRAVQNERIYRVGDHHVMPHGPIAREFVLREMAHMLYPDQFQAPQELPADARARPATFSP